MKSKWAVIDRDEQESIIQIDYCEKTMTFYTSRKSVGERLRKKVGEPTHIDTQNGLISGMTYVRNLHDEDVKKFLSVSTIIGGFRQNNNSNDELVEEE